MALSPETKQAIRRYGPEINPLARKRYGISGKDLLAKLVEGESGDRMGAVSSAGARGKTQFTAGSRAVAISKFGIDPWRSTDEAVHAAVLHLQGKINGSTGLAGYNPGDPNYTSYILGQPAHVGGRSPGSGGGRQIPASGPPALPGFDLQPGQDTTGLLASLLTQHQAPPTGQLTTPAYSARAALPQGYQGIQSSGGPAPRRDLSGLLEAISGAGTSIPGVQAHGLLGDAQNAGNTSQIPPGKIKGGISKFEGTQVAAWIKPILAYAREHGWKGQVNSGYRTREQQAAIYNSGVRPAARPGTSNHEGDEYPRGAVDVSDAQQLAQILRNSPYRKRLVWAGSKDPVHFSHPRNGTY